MNSKLVEYSPQAIANIQTVEEAKDGYEKLKALVSYFRDDYDQAFSFAVGMIECACRGGELLKENGFGDHGGNRKSRDTVSLDELGVERHQSKRWCKASIVSKNKREIYYEKMMDQEDLPTMAAILRLAKSPNQTVEDDEDYDGDEWYTPVEHIEAAREVMGSIDLDPATCEEAQEFIKATKFFTKEDNGLVHPWHGNIWLNPPYSYPLIENFVDKLIAEYKVQNTKQAIIIVNNSSDTKWFHKMLKEYLACFTKGRVSFWRPNTDKKFSTRQGQTFFYLGENISQFVQTFSEFGIIVKAIK